MSPSKLAAAFDGLGQTLYAQLARKPGNIALSPLSVGLAMAMTLSGARGDTEAEMRRVLGHDSRRKMETASAALVQSLEGYGRATATHVAIANALVLDEERGDSVRASYRELLRSSYAAEIMTGATPEVVNAWVSDKTMGLVPRLLDHVDKDVVALILNAMVFAAPWREEFDEESTRPGPFLLAGGETTPVPMMSNRLDATLFERAGYRAIRIPFSMPQLGLLCVVPRDVAELDAIGADLDLKSLLGSRSSPRLVDLTLPKFRIASDLDLVSALRAAGLRLAFEDIADFTGMAEGEPGVKISDVRHGACIEVHEKGCFAAAATVVGIAVAGSAKPPEPEPFAVDRPFLFFLVDDRTGATLMRGRIVDPRLRT